MAITKASAAGFASNKYNNISADNYYMEPIAKTLLSTSAANITFSSIPQTYKHLQIRGLVRSNRAGAADDLYMTINSDTGNNYAWHSVHGDASAVSVTAQTSVPNIHVMRNNLPSSTTTANMFGAFVIDILDYANTSKYKTVRTLMGGDFNNTITGYVGLMSGLWQSTNAITSLTLQEETGASLVQYSRIALYGIRG